MSISSPPVLVQSAAFDPTTLALADGGQMLFWSGDDADGKGIWAQRYDAAGGTFGAIYQINTVVTGMTDDDQSVPEAIKLADGTLLVTWMSGTTVLGDDLSVGTIQGQRLDASGNLLGSEFAINPNNTANYSRFSETAALDDGGFVAVYYSHYSDSTERSVYGQRFDSAGLSVGGEFRIGSIEGTGQIEPEVVGLVNGGFVAAWTANSGLWGGG